jgi:hypothetical protein
MTASRDGVASSRQVALLRYGFARLHNLQRDPLSLGAVHENPNRVFADDGKGQIPQIDCYREDDVAGIGWTVRDHFPGAAADFRAVGRRHHKGKIVLPVSLERSEPNPDYEREMGMVKRQRGAADPRNASAQNMELLTRLDLSRVREKSVLNLWHLPILADPASAGVTSKAASAAKGSGARETGPRHNSLLRGGYFSTPEMTTPRMNTRWEKKKIATGNNMASIDPAWIMAGEPKLRKVVLKFWRPTAIGHRSGTPAR